MLRPEQVETLRGESEWIEDRSDYKIPAFYLKDKKLVLPKLKEHEAIDMIDFEKQRKELRFGDQKFEPDDKKKVGSAGSSDTTDETLPWQQQQHIR